MLNEFVNKKNAMGTILRNPEEMEKLKRYANVLTDKLLAVSIKLPLFVET